MPCDDRARRTPDAPSRCNSGFSHRVASDRSAYDASRNRTDSFPQAYELSVLTGTQVLLLVVSETGLVYTFTTPKLQPLVTKPEGKNLIQVRRQTLP